MPQRVFCQQWEEVDGEGGVYPDGYSLHLSDGDRTMYVEAYWIGMPTAEVMYSRPCGTPYRVEVDVETYGRVRSATYGLRSYRRAPDSARSDSDE